MRSRAGSLDRATEGAIEEIEGQAKVRRTRHTYTTDELESLARTAQQMMQLGTTMVETADRLHIAVPTLRKALTHAGIPVPRRGRRPNFPHKIKPDADINLALNILKETGAISETDTVAISIPLRAIVADNHSRVVDYLLEGKPEGIKSAVRSLLDS
jgi:hypothetical protein